MITIDKIKIYKRFNGDIDGWVRVGTKEEKSIMNNNDWFLIEGFIQDINLVKKGLASDTFMNSINERLKENCDSKETIELIGYGVSKSPENFPGLCYLYSRSFLWVSFVMKTRKSPNRFFIFIDNKV